MKDFIFLHTEACLMLLVCPLTEEGTGSSPYSCRKKCDGGERRSLCYNQNTKMKKRFLIEYEYIHLSVEMHQEALAKAGMKVAIFARHDRKWSLMIVSPVSAN